MRQRLPNLLLLVFFLVILFLPTADEQLGLSLDRTQSTEKRNLAGKPALRLDSLSAFPKRYEDYLNDHISFRNLLIQLHAYWSWTVFDVSAVSDVLMGKDGWLYYVSKSQGNSLADFQGLTCLGVEKLESIRTGLEHRKQVLDELGIPFLIVVAPDKHSVYPDFLPDNVKRRGPCKRRLTQVVEFLEKHSSVRIVDLRDALLAAREKTPHLLYGQTDSHWSAWGGFVAYREIMKKLGRAPLGSADFVWTEETKTGGDLAGELSLKGRLLETRHVTVAPTFTPHLAERTLENDYGIPLNADPFIITNEDKTLPKLLIFPDSFGADILTFLPYHFRETIVVQSYFFSPGIIARERPDLVIFEVVERNAEFLNLN